VRQLGFVRGLKVNNRAPSLVEVAPAPEPVHRPNRSIPEGSWLPHHPSDPQDSECPDFAPTAAALAEGNELWQPPVTSYYLGQPIPDFCRAVTNEEQW
jgi:hypothetical protein